MDDYEIIDIHIHLCRDVAQEKTVFPKRGWPDSWYWSNGDHIVPYMDQNGVSHVMTVNIMDTGRMTEQRLARSRNGQDLTRAREALREEMRARVRQFNDWACEAHRKEPRIIACVMIDPVLFGDGALAELDRCIPQGAQGIKVHPSICGHFPDDPNMMPVYQRCQERGLLVLSDSNNAPNADGIVYGTPLNFAPVLATFPRLRFIMAHLCEEAWDDRIDLSRQFKDNLWFDISGGIVDLGHPPGGRRGLLAEQAVRVFRKVGVERVLFGTDNPGVSIAIREAAGQVLTLPLSEDEKVLILAGNARRYLGPENLAFAPRRAAAAAV